MDLRLKQIALMSLPDGGYNLSAKWGDFEKCSRYKLNFESVLTWKMGDSMTVKADLKGTATFRLVAGQFLGYWGKGTLTYDSYSAAFSGASEALNKYCTIEATDAGGTLSGGLMLRSVRGGAPGITGSGDSSPIPLNPVVALRPDAMDQHLPKWSCK